MSGNQYLIGSFEWRDFPCSRYFPRGGAILFFSYSSVFTFIYITTGRRRWIRAAFSLICKSGYIICNPYTVRLVSLEDNLLESLDQYVSENGFANRSQAIRFLVEKNVAEKKWQCNHIVAGTIILMYDQVKKDITSRIADIQQNYQDVILSSSQYYVNRNFCLHIATVMGTAYRLTELSDRLTTIKGLKHGKLVMSRAD